MFNKKLILLMITALFCSVVSAQSISKTGTTSAKFLSIGVGPRANAMGGAFSAVANDASAIYWNPAGIASITERQAIVTYTKLFVDINVDFGGFVLPAGNLGTFGLSFTALNSGNMEVTTEDYPEGTGQTFSAASYCVAFSYARYLTEEFAFGFSVKYIQETIFNSSATGIGFDVGTNFVTPFYGIKFASCITNYGTKMQMTGDDLLIRHDPDETRAGNNAAVDAYYSTDYFDLPLKLQIGISKDFKIMNDQRLTLAVDATHPNDNKQSVNVGGELAFFNNLIEFRGGYKSLFLDDTQEGLTLGVGLNYAAKNALAIEFDYSFQKYKYLDNVHSFGLILKF